jgi:uncharacterized surface protein with fasciclin (FAS1) repeats
MKNHLFSSVILGAALVVSSVPSTVLQAAPQTGPTIADIVVANPDVDGDGEGDFDTLLAAVLLADSGVLERLSSRGQNTVFAPTDAAFEAAFDELEAAGIDPEDVLADSELLTLVLEYHISPGLRTSTSVLNFKRIRMIDGGFLKQNGGVLTDNLGRDAAIIAVDVRAINGVIHAIDNVVLPALP